MGNDELIHIVRMGADRKIVARAAFKVSNAEVLGCVVFKLYLLIFKRWVARDCVNKLCFFCVFLHYFYSSVSDGHGNVSVLLFWYRFKETSE